MAGFSVGFDSLQASTSVGALISVAGSTSAVDSTSAAAWTSGAVSTLVAGWTSAVASTSVEGLSRISRRRRQCPIPRTRCVVHPLCRASRRW